MTLRPHPLLFALAPLALALALAAAARAAPPMDKITVADGRFAGPDGREIKLRGVNLGNWFLIEPWMFGVRDDVLNNEYSVDELLRERFGPEKMADLKRLWRQNWITEADFAAVRDFGFNAVRLPFHYAMLEDPNDPGHVAAGGFEWLDRAVGWAADNGVYVVLDMHAAPEHQSKDAPSGRVGYNRLWKDPVAQDRFVSLWRDIAAHYAGRGNVAAYDLVNEPWGEFNDAHAEVYGRTIDRAVKAVREADQDTPILIPALLGGNFRMFERIMDDPAGPASHGWTGIAFTDHYYPGLFGSEPSLSSHARHVAGLRGRIAQMKRWNAPLVVGEMQVVFDRLQQPRLMRWYYDYYNSLGWAPFAWSWKLVKPEAGVRPDGWYCVTNAEPWAVDLRNDSFEAIADKFRRLGTMKYVPKQAYKAAMTADAASLEPFELPPLGATTRPVASPPAGWAVVKVGAEADGGYSTAEGGAGFIVAGAGNDIFAVSDEFVFLHANAPLPAGDFTWATTVTGFAGPSQWAKAGLMVRASAAPDAAFVFVHVLPNGRVTAAARPATGATMAEQHLDDEKPGDFPIKLALRRTDGRYEVGYARGGAAMIWTDAPAAAEWGGAAAFGYAVDSNAPGYLAVASFAARPAGPAGK